MRRLVMRQPSWTTFALKREPIQLAILHEALRLVAAEELVRALTAQRTGSYLRKAAFVWEKANAQTLPLAWDTTGGNYVDFFGPDKYYTGPLWERSQKYRVNFNGIGPYEFCPVVERDAAREQRGQDVLDRLRAWVANPANAQLVDRVMVSFGFVFMHPFMDGNGRVSRLLAHHSLNFTEVLPTIGGQPAILPLSVAMKRNEKDYLAALEAFSTPARQLWDVTSIADSEFVFDYKSSPMSYAHWSAQAAAAFVTTCAELALEQSLIDETFYIQAYDRAYERIDRAFDLPNRTINLLIQWIRQNDKRLPERRKNAVELITLAPEQVEDIEAIVAECFRRDRE
jgi:Fic/DOC family